MIDLSMDKEIYYFDNAASSRTDQRVLAYYREISAVDYANQEAAHGGGYALRKRLEAAAEKLSLALCGEKRLVIWGNSGTELFNLLADSFLVEGKEVAASPLEHPALLANLKRTARNLQLLPCGRDGKVQIPENGFAALHHVQSELGTIQEFPQRQAVTFCDAIQSAGKLPLPRTPEIIAVSGHKFGAPGGAALLLKSDWKDAKKLQDFAHSYRHISYRCGRPDPALSLAMTKAAELAAEERNKNLRNTIILNNLLRENFSATIPAKTASPYILHLNFPGHQSGVLVRMLSDAGFMVAAGSACASETDDPSPAMRAIGFSKKDAFSGLRISFGPQNTVEEAKKLQEALTRVLKNY